MPTTDTSSDISTPGARSLLPPVIGGALAAAAFAATFGVSSQANAATLDACGGVWLEGLAEGSCEVVPVQECETRCQTVSAVTVCAARLTTECNSSCTLEASVECEGSCGETCVGDCSTDVEQQPPNCMGLCMSDCQMEATAGCEDTDKHGQCRSSGAHCCADRCRNECDQATETTTCEPVCTSACTGSCDARANLQCQVGCQAERFTTCEETVVEECNTECEQTGAAIFCEGQFLATGGDLEACANDLAASFDFQLDVEIDIDVECSDGGCEAEGEGEGDAGVGCGLTIDPKGRRSLGGWAVFMLLGLGAWRMRRR